MTGKATSGPHRHLSKSAWVVLQVLAHEVGEFSCKLLLAARPEHNTGDDDGHVDLAGDILLSPERTPGRKPAGASHSASAAATECRANTGCGTTNQEEDASCVEVCGRL